jgi:spermidine synthase
VQQREDGRVALEVGGVVQSIQVPAGVGPGGAATTDPAGGYWAAMLPARAPRRALLLGLGGGTVAHLLAQRFPGVQLVGVERDETVLVTARLELGLDDVPGLSIALADAFTWVPTAALREQGAYDLICLDLFQAGRLAPGTLVRDFLRQVAALLAPEGTLAVNLMVTGRTPEQLERLQRVFRLVSTTRVRGNLVAHLRLPPPSDAAELPSAPEP